MAFPEPPWTQAPSEVMAWRSSVGARTKTHARSHRPMRVKGYEVRVPVTEEPRLLARMAGLGLGHVKDGRVHLPHLITRLAPHANAELFFGRVGGTHLEIRLRKGSRLEVRVGFTPQIAFRKAWRIVARLGLRPTEGTWL